MLLQYSEILQYYWFLKKNSSWWHTDSKKIRTMFHGACALSYQSIIKMMFSPSVKKRRKNYYSGDFDEAITNIQTGDISQEKAVFEYGLPHQMLAQKCKKK